MKTALDDPAEHLTLQQLRFLQDLARTKKLTKTASNFGMSLTSASRTLDKLRTAFGDQLMTPQARGLAPTEGLARLLPELGVTIEQTSRLFRPFVFDPKTLEGRFRLVSRGLAVPDILAYVVPRIAKEAPGLVLEHRPRTSAVWEDIAEGRADLAFVTDRNVPASFHALPLFDIEVGILMRRGHPLETLHRAGAITLDDLSAYGRIAMEVSADYRNANWDRQLFSDERADRGVACTTTYALELAATIEASDLVMLAPRFGSRGVMRHYNLVWIPMPKPASSKRAAKTIIRHGVMVWSETVHRDPAHAWVRSLFREWAAKAQVEAAADLEVERGG